MKRLLFICLALLIISTISCDSYGGERQIEGTVLDIYVGNFDARSHCVSVVVLDTEDPLYVYCPDADKLSVGHRYILNLAKPGPVDYWIIKRAELVRGEYEDTANTD